jgi:hypothetical protein
LRVEGKVDVISSTDLKLDELAKRQKWDGAGKSSSSKRRESLVMSRT